MKWEEFKDIVNDVINLTRDNKIKWNCMGSEREYFTRIGDATMIVGRYLNSGYDQYDYDITILNKSGEILYQFPTRLSECNDKEFFSFVYDVVENSYLHKDRTIRSMKNAIKVLKDLR